MPSPRDPVARVEREAVKAALQYPALAGAAFDSLTPDEFTIPAYAAVRQAVLAAGGAVSAENPQFAASSWTQRVQDQAPDDAIRGLVTELTVERMISRQAIDDRYVNTQMTSIRLHSVDRRIGQLRPRLQRLNPVQQQDEYNKLFGEMVALEGYRRGLVAALAG